MKSPSPIFVKRKVSHTPEVSEETPILPNSPQTQDDRHVHSLFQNCPNGAKRQSSNAMKILYLGPLMGISWMFWKKIKHPSHEFRLEYWSNCHQKKTTLLFTYIKLYIYGFGQKWGMPLFWGSIGGKWAINHQPFGFFPPCLADHLMLSLSDRKNMEKLWKKSCEHEDTGHQWDFQGEFWDVPHLEVAPPMYHQDLSLPIPSSWDVVPALLPWPKKSQGWHYFTCSRQSRGWFGCPSFDPIHIVSMTRHKHVQHVQDM